MELKPLSTTVLEAGSHEISLECEDEAARGRFCIVHGKAHGSAYWACQEVRKWYKRNSGLILWWPCMVFKLAKLCL